ncbi:hypothetical protein HZA97_04095 [Candidatus Woesearchaeota archaeon]|nr:hypothetical protein [Candidatus Woesearchaeota archaeon]
MTKAIVTVPPYAPFISEVAKHPVVSGLRLNTVMPVKESLEELLLRLQSLAKGKPVFIDLKGRQLRTASYATPPFTEVKISHKISVNTPVTAYFGNGREHATLSEVDGDKLIFLDGPQRVVGPGESINIPDSSLVIQGSLTETDLKYIEAAKKVGMHDYMLSFVESAADVAELKRLDEKANIVAKIESVKGLDFVRKEYKNNFRLMAARGDLYVEVSRPHQVLEAVESIVEKDKNAIAASRILSSMALSPEPSCEDISDVAYLIKSGYKTLMLGDEVCLKRDPVIGALNLLAAIFRRYD